MLVFLTTFFSKVTFSSRLLDDLRSQEGKNCTIRNVKTKLYLNGDRKEDGDRVMTSKESYDWNIRLVSIQEINEETDELYTKDIYVIKAANEENGHLVAKMSRKRPDPVLISEYSYLQRPTAARRWHLEKVSGKTYIIKFVGERGFTSYVEDGILDSNENGNVYLHQANGENDYQRWHINFHS